MRILFDSQERMYKDPFGTLTPGQICTLRIRIPTSVGAVKAVCILEPDNGGAPMEALLKRVRTEGDYGDYDIFEGQFSLSQNGLYFYYFRICKPAGSFRLFKQGRDTNMEAGDMWQVTCVPADFTTPDWAKGTVIYQIFPDRFCKSGQPDLADKLMPYTLHAHWSEEVQWMPDENGKVLNNDFFGGNFRGIAEKMDYIASFGTGIIYLNPIGKSFSSHRYDTAHYKLPDPMLGTLEDFEALCQEAHKRKIRVILDGVYSHTGANSIYFQSACASPDSPYFSWYRFQKYPTEYDSWWGFDTLPTVNKLDPGFRHYIIDSEDSVVAHWLKHGADGFRLDVADELPDAFILRLKKRIRQIRPDALLMGEVWEDASNKIAYGIRRRYFADGELDSVMNYPFRTAILDFMTGKDDGRRFQETVMQIAENYPPQVLACNMNLLGSHDTPRVLTALWDDFVGSREDYAKRALSPTQKQTARDRLFMASFLQYTLPGCPGIYYGDEAGMEGYADPFNRRTYPWGVEDSLLNAHYRQLGNLRKFCEPLRLGDIHFSRAQDGKLCFCREYNNRKIEIYVNRSTENWDIPKKPVLYSSRLRGTALLPNGFCITEETKWRKNTF